MNAPSPHRPAYDRWPDDAVHLVENAIRAHGGWKRWRRLDLIRIEPGRLGGALPLIKGLNRTFNLPRCIVLSPHSGGVTFEGFPDEARNGHYDENVLSIVDATTTETLSASVNHRASFGGLARFRRWTPLDALYFFGYALLHYHSMPFTLGEGVFVGVREVRSRGEELTALVLDFPPERVTHSTRQTIFFDREGIVRRHDYVADVVGPFARGCHFWDDYEMVAGLRFAMKRRVVVRALGRPLPITVLDAEFQKIEVKSPAD